MMKIKILTEDTVNKIAAGEVVERPASIVKELIENSLDAGATRIDVEVKGSGKNLIRVTDDGSGMEKDDAVLAFSRHATSKIVSAADLTRIGSFGFRGEALPSIASVTKVEMITRTMGKDAAIRIRKEGSKLLEVKETGAPEGTMVTVNNLFYNTPARRKFLKSNNTELNHIVKMVTNYCLVYTQCRFSLTHNDDRIIEVLHEDSLLDRIRVLYGNEIAEAMLPIDYQQEGIKISGFVSRPAITRPNRNGQLFFVNKRPIIDRTIGYAVSDSYRSLIPQGRFPVVFLFLEIDPETVDVNVHPAKKEVKFENVWKIKDVIKKSILNALGVPAVLGAEETFIRRGAGPVGETPDFSQAGSVAMGVQEVMLGVEGYGPYKAVQVLDAFIVTESGGGLEIMDQHAAHERILYEKIKQWLKNKSPESQRLLLPVNVELPPGDKKVLVDNMDFFRELGFNIEEFGAGTVLIDMIPVIMDKADLAEFVNDTVSEIKETGKAGSPDVRRDVIMKMMACKGAVKQGDRLDTMEMKRILQEWQKLGKAGTCPHGRPCVIRFTKAELNKKFQRT